MDQTYTQSSDIVKGSDGSWYSSLDNTTNSYQRNTHTTQNDTIYGSNGSV